ncbi:phosphate acetyltransferase [Dyadobacter fanqingshengii]|uniref:Phosphate acetyltransferase n=1 Tax=Dyadobacter fanqingshengii TaxID=2906443 RepID=A0A9X1PDX7_9BACT|nr:phosphate acetyltransferase [Dyadobacter fanqingshengii]MCF0042715.1 phosphate acetyltransferase [Dyadobacter fanqingshengii]MCF2504514.1 phosphate acetyltransferase [Dyadobacter fanqingshengii]USJ36061.1 phosphate acetyltransferase [Dyadobacter fanqingshengii]
MTKTIFIASAEPYAGKSVIALGLVNMLLSKTKKIGFFKPIISQQEPGRKDKHIEAIINYFSLPIPYEDTFAFTRQEVLQHPESENWGEMINTIISKFKKLEEAYDFTVIEGSDFLGEGIAFEFESNAAIAKNLGAPVLTIINGENKSTAQIINSSLNVLRNFESREVQVLGIVANRVKAEQVDDVRELLRMQLPDDIMLTVIPWEKALQSPTMREITDALDAKVLFGEHLLSSQVDNYVTGAMMLPNFLKHIKENVLIITPGDRGDIVIGALQANLSTNYPKVAGIVLTAGTIPEEPVIRLIEGLQTIIPIISVQQGTFGTTTAIGAIHSRITADNTKKIELAIDTFEKYVDMKVLDDKIITFQPEGITPHMFQYQLVKWAKSQKKHIVLPEGNDDRILRAAARLISQNVVDLTILGDPTEVAAAVKRLGIDLDLNVVRIVNPANSENYEDYVETLYELRKNKNVNLEMARDLMTDVSYFGTMMVYKGHADGMVSGAVHTTQHTIRPALQFIKTKPGVSIVSSIFFMCLPDRVAIFGDCAVNPNPTASQLADIAISSAESSARFGIEPRIAMLSYSSGTSGEGEDVERVREATAIVKERAPHLKVEGPIQYDAAVDPIVGNQKLSNSEVAGKASVLIFPDLNTGNNTYKAVQRETGALAIGPMLQGLNKPINDLSRGCTVDDIFNTVVITAIQCQQE